MITGQEGGGKPVGYLQAYSPGEDLNLRLPRTNPASIQGCT